MVPEKVFYRRFDVLRLNFRKIFSNRANTVIQGGPGCFSFSRTAGNADDFHGILLSIFFCWRLMPWLLWKLCAMPYRNYPNNITLDFIKKTVWRYNHLPVGKFWKFWYDSSGFRKALKPSQNCFGMFSKTGCSRRFIPPNICESRQKLGSGRRRKADFHDGSRDRIKSASARTVSRS